MVHCPFLHQAPSVATGVFCPESLPGILIFSAEISRRERRQQTRILPECLWSLPCPFEKYFAILVLPQQGGKSSQQRNQPRLVNQRECSDLFTCVACIFWDQVVLELCPSTGLSNCWYSLSSIMYRCVSDFVFAYEHLPYDRFSSSVVTHTHTPQSKYCSHTHC